MRKKSVVISDTARSSTGGEYKCKVQRYWYRPTLMSEPLKVVTIAFDATLEVDPQRALLGDRIILKCLISGWEQRGYPFNWYKNKVFQEQSYVNYIYIENANHSDAATYRCEAEGMFRKQVSGDVTITVTDLCSTPTLNVEPGVRVLAGQRLRITCLVQQLHVDYPLLRSLLKDGERLGLPGGRYTTGWAAPEDSGVYQCEVTSSKGSYKEMSLPVFVSVELIPVSKPDLQAEPGAKVIEGEKTSLICSVSTGSAPITYVFIHNLNKEIYWEISNDSRITYKMTDVRKNSEGNYSCKVSNKAPGLALQSKSIEVAVIVPVDGASITSEANNTEVPIGGRLVLHCLLKAGTSPQFLWYLNRQRLENSSEYYDLRADVSELNIHSFQKRHEGWYHCEANNAGPNGVRFNTTSNEIHITAPVQSKAIVTTASTLPLLIAALAALCCFKLRNKAKGNSSSVAQQQGDATATGSQNSSREPPASNFEHALVDKCPNIDSTYCAINQADPAEDVAKSEDGVVYSVVTIAKSRAA
ncbi:Down syndrome cell adhesion molecule-like protein 1 homolog, partial [Carcharodon carcharias]|uniref:Down syndrome cell adhesion molecule-like protein 1 homolog n=1 Tax=Carcharodon carcharias TaxID=13397 RepID=UPI001B7F6254